MNTKIFRLYRLFAPIYEICNILSFQTFLDDNHFFGHNDICWAFFMSRVSVSFFTLFIGILTTWQCSLLFSVRCWEQAICLVKEIENRNKEPIQKWKRQQSLLLLNEKRKTVLVCFCLAYLFVCQPACKAEFLITFLMALLKNFQAIVSNFCFGLAVFC